MTGKLYGTLGPACADTDTLRALLRAGMSGMRLNLSHCTLAESADRTFPSRPACAGICCAATSCCSTTAPSFSACWTQRA